METPLLAVLDHMLAFWPYAVTLLNVVFSLLATGHAVLSKRDTRAAIGWVGVIWLAPLVGVLLYAWLGIHRIERRARSLRAERPRADASPAFGAGPAGVPDQAELLAGTPLEPLVKLVRDVSRRPWLAGNRVRHQHPCGQLPGAATPSSRSRPALSPQRARGGPTPGRVRR